MDKIFQRLLETNFSDLRGTTVAASIPLSQSLINELVREALKGNRTIAPLQLYIHPQNRVSLDMKTTLLPWPLNLKLRLDTSVDLASYSSPKIRAWLENNRLLGSLGSLFNALPEGIRLYGNQAVVDLGAFLRTPDQKRFLSLVKSVDIRTEDSRVILDVQAAVDQ